jgi:hypothetical protein
VIIGPVANAIAPAGPETGLVRYTAMTGWGAVTFGRSRPCIRRLTCFCRGDAASERAGEAMLSRRVDALMPADG